MRLTIGELSAVILILAAVSLGFLTANPSSAHLTPVSSGTVSKFLGGSWTVNYVYTGSGYHAKVQGLQQYKDSEVLYENLTDSLGDKLIILYVYPYSGNNTVYHYGLVTLMTLSKGNAYVMISYVGNSAQISINEVESLANYILSNE